MAYNVSEENLVASRTHKSKMNPRCLLVLPCLLIPSCQEPIETTSEGSDGSVIDGDAWTLAKFSDFFDEDLTAEDVKAAFGSDPMVTTEGDTTELFYALGSQKSHDNGMRIHTIKVFFRNGKFTEFEIGRVGISD
jgi:hypothetical protein